MGAEEEEVHLQVLLGDAEEEEVHLQVLLGRRCSRHGHAIAKEGAAGALQTLQ